MSKTVSLAAAAPGFLFFISVVRSQTLKVQKDDQSPGVVVVSDRGYH